MREHLCCSPEPARHDIFKKGVMKTLVLVPQTKILDFPLYILNNFYCSKCLVRILKNAKKLVVFLFLVNSPNQWKNGGSQSLGLRPKFYINIFISHQLHWQWTEHIPELPLGLICGHQSWQVEKLDVDGHLREFCQKLPHFWAWLFRRYWDLHWSVFLLFTDSSRINPERKASSIGKYETRNLTRMTANLKRSVVCRFVQHLAELFHIHLAAASWCWPDQAKSKGYFYNNISYHFQWQGDQYFVKLYTWSLIRIVAVCKQCQLDVFHIIRHFHEFCQNRQTFEVLGALQCNLQWGAWINLRNSCRVNPEMKEIYNLRRS